MIHLIVSGHGEFASGLLSGLKVLAGENEACTAVDFPEGMGGEALQAELQRVLTQAGTAPVLFLTDIIGGTPFRASATLALSRPETEVISGVNLHILLEAVMERKELNLKDLVQQLQDNGRAGISILSLTSSPTPRQDEDGI